MCSSIIFTVSSMKFCTFLRCLSSLSSVSFINAESLPNIDSVSLFSSLNRELFLEAMFFFLLNIFVCSFSILFSISSFSWSNLVSFSLSSDIWSNSSSISPSFLLSISFHMLFSITALFLLKYSLCCFMKLSAY